MHSLFNIRKQLMADLVKEDDKPYDEYRSGVGAGITMALIRIEQMIEEEEREQERYYGED